MTARTCSLRFVALCGVLLLLLLAVALARGSEANALRWSLCAAPLAFGALFVFNKIAAVKADEKQRAEDLSKTLTGPEIRASNVIGMLVLVLGLMCASVAAFVPQYLSGVVWVCPVLAGSAGIHLAAVI
jgi:hypothetical protein